MFTHFTYLPLELIHMICNYLDLMDKIHLHEAIQIALSPNLIKHECQNLVDMYHSCECTCAGCQKVFTKQYSHYIKYKCTFCDNYYCGECKLTIKKEHMTNNHYYEKEKKKKEIKKRKAEFADLMKFLDEL